MRPRLKGISWERAGDELRLVYYPRDQLLLTDPDGTVEKLVASSARVAGLAPCAPCAVHLGALPVAAFASPIRVQSIGFLAALYPGRYEARQPSDDGGQALEGASLLSLIRRRLLGDVES